MRDYAREAGTAFEKALEEANNPNIQRATAGEWAAIAQAAASIQTLLELNLLRQVVEKIAAKP